MISIHEARKICHLVKEEEKWFSQVENMLTDGIAVEKIEDVCKFKDLIWSNSSSEVVLKSEETSGCMICAPWFAADG